MERKINPNFGCRLPTTWREAIEIYGDDARIPSTIHDCIRHGLKTWTEWAAWQARRTVLQHYGRMQFAYIGRRIARHRGSPTAPHDRAIRAMLPEYRRARWERAYWARLAAEAKPATKAVEALADGLGRVERVLEPA